MIRGLGFSKFPISGVSFGGFPASGFTVASDTQIEAIHPPLAAGRYAVQLQVDGATVPVKSDAELVVVVPPAFAAASISYPTPNPTVVKALYDTERSALIVVTTQSGGELLRFRQTGDSWGAVDSLPIDTLHDVALSANGRHLLAVTDSGVLPIDADTFATEPAWAAPLTSGTTLSGISVANDGRAIVTTTAADNTATPLYLLNPRTGDFTASTSLINALPVGSGDGSLILITQQDTTAATTPALYQFSASTGALSTALSINRNAILPAIDRFATRLALNGLAAYGSSYNLIGTLPDTTLAAAFSPDGTRLYAYDSTAVAVLAYDTSTTVEDGSTLNVTDTYFDVTGDPGAEPRLTVSSAGDAVFLAGNEKIAVIPVVQQ